MTHVVAWTRHIWRGGAEASEPALDGDGKKNAGLLFLSVGKIRAPMCAGGKNPILFHGEKTTRERRGGITKDSN